MKKVTKHIGSQKSQNNKIKPWYENQGFLFVYNSLIEYSKSDKIAFERKPGIQHEFKNIKSIFKI